MAGAFVLGFALIYVPLFSNFFFYPEGLADGIYKGVEVWAGAHDIRRLDQPWFYYPWMMFLYETVATFVYLVAFVAMPVQFIVRAVRKQKIGFSVKGVFAGLMLWWAALAMVVYSIAGEKAPWLNMQIALPATIAAAIFLDGWLRRVDWRGLVKPTGGLLFLGLMGLLLAATFVIIGLLVNLSPAQVNSNLRIQQIIELVIVAIVAMVLFGSIYWLWRSGRIKGTLMRASIALIFIGLLLAYEVRSTIALNYAHPDTAVEIMIYVQTTPEVPLLMQRLDRLARDVRDTNKLAPPAQGATQADPSNSRGLPVLVTQEVAWPMVWYLRDYTNVSYTAPNTDYNSSVQALPLQDSRNNDYAVIMLQGYENNTKVQELLRDKYTATTFKMRWWFPEDDSGYGGLGVVPPGSTNPNLDKKKIQYTDWAKWWRAVSEQPYAGQLWRFLMYRELPQPLQAVEMVVYVRNDLYPDFNLTNNTGGSNTAIGAGTGTNVQPTAGTTQQVFALTESTGAGNRNGQYKTPRGITIAPNGDFLVMDSGNGRVQRFAPDGTFISKFGNIGTGDGQFQVAQFDGGAGGIATDEEGNIYVADSWNYRIQKFDKDGKFLLKWGSGFDTKGELNINAQNPYGLYGPRGLAYDAGAGELYVADTGNRRVLIFDKQGKYLRQFGSKGSGQAQFDEPVGIALSPDGKVFVSDLRNKRIQIFDKQGKYLNEFKVAAGWQEQPLSEPYMTFDKQGILYVSDSPNGRIYKYTADGQFLQTIENQTGAPMVNPVGLVINPADGFLYVADAKRNAVVKVKP
jgi:DNA-binding beta-propeller fold protein YncE